MRRTTLKAAAVAAALVLGVTACDSGTSVSGDTAQLKVMLTDAPADYVAGAWVDIGAVQLVPGDADGMGNMDGTGNGGIITLTDDGTDGMVNLLELQDAATSQLADLEIPVGTYSQLRLIVDSARVDLIDGYTFRDGSTSQPLFVPSGAQTGIKLNLQGSNGEGDGTMGGVEIAPGQTVLVLDFDVNQSFRIQGNPESPAGIMGFHFQPTLRVVVNDVAGSIAGTVTAAADSMNVVGLTVTAEPQGTGTLEDYQTQTATAVTDSAGAYTIHFLVPGDYAVSVAADSGFAATPAGTDVTVGEAASVTGIDFEVQEDAGS